MRFLLLFLLVLPVIEITLLIKVGQQVGVLATLGLLFFMGVVGMALLRQQGFSTLLRVNERVQRGDMPAQEILEGVVIAAGALLLVIPGFFTDCVAILCFIPFTRRRLVRHWLKKARVLGGVQGAGQFYHYRSSADDVIEGEFQRESSARIDKQP